MTYPYKLSTGVALIGIHGKAHSGKDSIATFITSTYKNHWIEAFAYPLKDAAAAAFGISREHFAINEEKEKINEFWGVSPRQIAQFMGTEMFRDTLPYLIPSIGGDFWVKRMYGRLNNQLNFDEVEYEHTDTIVIPDVRFENEEMFIKENGGIILHVVREGADGDVGIPNHGSESYTVPPDERTYYVENTGTLNQLYRQVADILISTKY